MFLCWGGLGVLVSDISIECFVSAREYEAAGRALVGCIIFV